MTGFARRIPDLNPDPDMAPGDGFRHSCRAMDDRTGFGHGRGPAMTGGVIGLIAGTQGYLLIAVAGCVSISATTPDTGGVKA